MKKRFLGKLMVLLAACGLAGAASADTATWSDGQKIAYEGATATWEGSELVLKFTTSTGAAGTQTGSLKLPSNATADIIVVGGGGSGGGGRWNNSTATYGAGGNGGQVVRLSNQSLGTTTYSISVGNGGAAPNSDTDGNNGVASSIKGGTLDKTATGGNGGSRRNNNVTAGSAGSGAFDDYGKAGAAATTYAKNTSFTPSDGAANTGSGGQGGGVSYPRNGTRSATKGGAGGSGVVIVRITQMDPVPPVIFKGQTIAYSGAEVTTINGEPVFTFSDAAGGSLTLPAGYTTLADYLVIGGGGSGSSARSSSGWITTTYYYGNGGGGGQGKTGTNVEMPAGMFSITVGKGGESVKSSGSSYVAGKKGGDSSISLSLGSGFDAVTAAGGAAGATTSKTSSPGNAGTGGYNQAAKAITGTDTVYGANGAGATTSTPTSGVNGGGGQGGYNQAASGAGGDGVVVIRLKDLYQIVERTATVKVGENVTLSDFAGTVTSVGSKDSVTASVTQSGNTVTVTGGSRGTAVVEVRNDSTASTPGVIYRYTVTVTADPIAITLCVGDVVKFNYDLGDNVEAYARYQVYGDGAIVKAEVAKQGAASGDFSRSVCLTITARQPGTQQVDLQTALKNGTFSPYETINVTVQAPRLYQVGDTDDFTCFASAFTSGTGKTTWDALTQSPAGIVTVNYSGVQSARSAGVHFVGAANGTTVVTAKNVTGSNGNLKGVEYNLLAAVIAPHEVTLAKGDHVQIWYNNTALKTWSLILNGTTYEAGKTGEGNGFDAAVKTGTEGGGTAQQAYIDIAAKGASAESDLIIVTDGENYYAYRMTCTDERVIKVGESVQVTCRTVSTFDWSAQVGENSAPYVSATCPSHDEDDTHGSTVTITGLEPFGSDYDLDYAYVQMHNEHFEATEVNAQGAIYQLACKVVGGPIVQVHLSAGAFLWPAVGYWAGTNATYTVTTNESEWTETVLTDKSQVGFKNYEPASFTCKWHTETSNQGLAPQLEITAKPDAPKGDYVVYTVWAGNEKVVTYIVNVTTTFQRMIAVGQTAEGFLWGAEQPWVSQSSDPSICEVSPTIYQNLYSAQAIPKRAGDVVICSTNPVTRADYWGIVLKPYEIHERTVEINKGASLEVTLPTNVYTPALQAPWSIETPPSGKVTAELASGTAADATSATVRITAGSSVGTDSIVVGNIYYVEKINVRVVDSTRRTVVIDEKYQVQVGSALVIDLAENGLTGKWEAESEHGDLVETETSGEGSTVSVMGRAAGESVITVTTDDTVYFLTVEATRRQGDLPVLVLWVDQNGNGQQLMTNLIGKVEADRSTVVTGIRTDDNMIADVMAGAAMGLPQVYAVMAKQEGSTWIHVQTSDSEYLQEVVVKLNHIDKKDIKLVFGLNGTHSSLKDKFYQIVSYSNIADRVSVTQLGNEITIAPTGALGHDEVFVQCYQADYPDFPVTVHYWIDVDQRPEDEIREFDQGYIAYRGVSDIYEDGEGDNKNLVMVFTNVDENAQFMIPTGLTARIDMLAIGGGGAGGSVAGGLGTGGAGGGGAGGFNSVTNKKFQSGTFTIAVGQGGQSFDSMIMGQSLAGGIGFDSYVTNQFGYIFIIANGGGGGGAPSKSEYIGNTGGSGGGAAWNGETAGQGGKNMEGQGSLGGTPSEYKCGGGGGGAGGVGGADQSAGPGKTSSISGVETLYSVGGKGGRLDVVAAGQSGTGYGFGGDGGSNASGGDGSDGIVILRMTRLFKNILVPIPTTNDFLTTLRTEWTNNTDVTVFPYEGREFRSPTDMELRYWTEAIDHVTGSNTVHCAWGEEVTTDEDGNLTTNKVGVGYYALNVYLKDGYAWDDGTQYGSTEYMRFNWVITEDINNVDARVEVSKTIIWEDDSPNAIVRVNTSTSPEMSGQKTPKVLMLGTLCSTHKLTAETIVKSINAITETADVDYYFYKNNDCQYNYSLKKGESVKQDIKVGTNAHFALLSFYKLLYEKLVQHKNEDKYDYIVFEFDGSRIAKYYTTQYSSSEKFPQFANEAEVAAALEPFYAAGQVIWIVDNGNESTSEKEKFTPYWVPNTYFYSGGEGDLDKTQYRALLGLFDPTYYGKGTEFKDISATNKTVSGKIYYANNPNVAPDGTSLQAHYDNPGAVTDLLRSVIKVKPFDLSYEDKIMSPASGLTITGVTVIGCATPDPDDATKPSENPDDWLPIIEWTPADFSTATAEGYYGSFTTHPENFETLAISGATMSVTTNSLVKVAVSNCAAQVWTRFDTHVHDDGTFCTSENAEYNQQTGKFEKNPNDGRAKVGVVMGGGGSGMDIDGDAETAIPWRFTAFEIRGHVSGNMGGDIYVGGTRYQKLSYPEGRDVSVYYRAWGGYRLTALRVDTDDHNSKDELEDFATGWTFEKLDKEHDVYVTFTSYFGDTESEPATYQYDAAAHVYPVNLIGWEDIYETEVRYSPNPNAKDDKDWLNAEDFAAMYSDDRNQTGVGEHTYWYRVFAYQPGYGTNFNEKGWVWVDTGIAGSNTVTITKAPLVITADSFKLGFLEDAPDEQEGGITINYGDDLWRGVTVEGLYEGDEVVTNGTIKILCPTYEKWVGQYVLEPTYADGKDAADIDPLGNYEIEFRPGALSIVKSPMVIGGVSQFGELDADDPLVNTGVQRVEKTYDGEPTNITVRIDKPTGTGEGEDFHIQYSTDGENWSDVNPAFTHAGTNRVWYSVTSGDSYENSNYFYVTNFSYVIISPAEIELTSASATKGYDGKALTCNEVELTDGELFGDDTFTFQTSGAQTDVGSSANTFTYELVSGDADINAANDYKVTVKEGALTVTYASIEIGGVTHPATTDPTKALDYGKTGVKDVEVTYDGTGWNIEVEVGAPVSGAVVHYSTNRNDPASWTSTLAFTNVGEYVVYFAVDAANYASVTNFAKVTILPYPVTVTADDQYNVQGEAEPEYTVTVGDLALRDRGHEAELIKYPAPTCPTFPADGETIGEYPIVFDEAETVREQGNYVVTFVPGTLFIEETARVGALWIVDHEDCDSENTYLAFKPTLSSGDLDAETVVGLAEAHKIKVAYATDEEALKSAVPTAVELRDQTGVLDVDKGWIWVKVPVVLNDLATGPILWKVMIDR